MPAVPDQPIPTHPGAPTTARTPAPFGHVAGLDGLRGIAIILALCYHAHMSFATGGFVGVTMFFTLSGFLITSLLLREFDRNGKVDLGRFWSRRFRRLLPAGYATIALVVVMGAVGIWDGDQLRSLRSDVPGALGQVLNWVFIAKGTSYAGATTAPSPLNHFWSLAIEEQFYVVFPLLAAGLLAVARRRRAPLVAVLMVLAAGSAWWNAHLAGTDLNRAYFGLDTRMSELLLGALLACATLYRTQITNWWLRQVTTLVGVAALATLGFITANATFSTQWMYPWGFLLVAVCTAALIVSAMQASAFARALGWKPLAWVGTISYGLYLYHWPIFQWLTPRRTGLTLWPLFGVRMAITIVIAVVSYRFLEHPIRTGTALRGRTLAAVLGGAAVLLLVSSTLVAATAAPPQESLAGLERSTTTAPPPPQRVLIVGDETAASLIADPTTTDGVIAAANVVVESSTAPGCGVSFGGTRVVSGQSTEAVNPPNCAGAAEVWSQAVASFQPDVVVVMAGFWDVTDRQFWSEDPIRHPGEQTFDDFLGTEMFGRTEELASGGATVAWATMAPQRRQLPGVALPPELVPENDPARAGAYNARLNEVVESSERARVLDVATKIASLSSDPFDPTIRPDGAALSPPAAAQVLAWALEEVAGISRVIDAGALGGTGMVDPFTPGDLPPAPAWTPLTLAPNERPRIMVAGDSVAFGLGYALQNWAAASGTAEFLQRGQFNCPIARGGSYRFQTEVAEFPDRCDWGEQFLTWVAESRPHEVTIFNGVWDIVDRILPGDRKWRHMGDPVLDAYFLRELLTAIDVFSSQGARVTLLTHHYIESGAQKGFQGLPESEHARVDRYNELLHEAAALRPGVVSVVDFAAGVQTGPNGMVDPANLTDGLHFTDEALVGVSEWLGPQLVELASRP